MRIGFVKSGVIVLAAMLGFPAAGQWINYPTEGIPRAKNGKPILTARVPHMPNGKPDLSGVWHGQSASGEAPQGTDGDALPKYFLDITRDVPPADVPFQPWAAELYQQRKENFGKDDPISRCLPPRRASVLMPDGVPLQDHPNTAIWSQSCKRVTRASGKFSSMERAASRRPAAHLERVFGWKMGGRHPGCGDARIP